MCNFVPKDYHYECVVNDDIQPIKKCGIGVAVANSISKVLEAADVITLSNDEDGVALWIEERLLCNL